MHFFKNLFIDYLNKNVINLAAPNYLKCLIPC